MADAAATSAPPVQEARDALTVLPLALPQALARRIWGALPCDARLRCREVCPAWRDALAEPRLWSEVDLTANSGVTSRVTPALLRAAAARADGQLERLFVTYDWRLRELLLPALLAVVAANPETLRLLRLEDGNCSWFFNEVETLLRVAPRQCVVEDMSVHPAAGHLLRTNSLFQALRLRKLRVDGRNMHVTESGALAANLAAHASLRELALHSAPLDTFAALDAVVDAALTLRLTKLVLKDCRVGPESAVALPRLLRGDALRELALDGRDFALDDDVRLLDAHAAALLADALRSNRTLTSLKLDHVGLWRGAGTLHSARSLFDALVGHASLTSISLCADNPGAHRAAGAGAMLGVLVAADSPQLRVLDISYNRLGDDSLGPLMDALPRNTHLRELRCSSNWMRDAFARDRLMPALAANTSLQKLDSDYKDANDFIATRTAAMAAA